MNNILLIALSTLAGFTLGAGLAFLVLVYLPRSPYD